IERNRVTVMHFVPSMLNIFLDHLRISGDTGTGKVASLKQVFSSGEELTPAQVKRFERLLYKPFATRLANLYGPTEATIDVSYFDCFRRGQNELDSVPIGKPIANTGLYILDGHSHLQPVGVAGELCLGGVGLARGYLNRPELTREKFELRTSNCELPFPLYHTGDLARWLADGNIEFLGRIDHQVKVRGFRVELGEIEYHLLEYDTVKEAVVIIRHKNGNQNDEPALCACIVTRHGSMPDVTELRNYLSHRLPGYMVPSFFKQLDRLPLTPSGKLNRAALDSSGDFLGSSVEYIAPGTPTEMKIASIWKEVLGGQESSVGVNDNFFDMGGTSMDVIRVNRQMTRQFNKTIPIIALYKYTTVGALAHLVDHGESGNEDTYSENKRQDRVKKGRRDKTKMRQMRRRGGY
ncbi:MAG: non-ribosomal peptide synthetase, partial [bacterium]|nr:non-ribosomal peptide synthetase [bacterium]